MEGSAVDKLIYMDYAQTSYQIRNLHSEDQYGKKIM